MITQSIFYASERNWVPVHVFGLFYSCLMCIAVFVIPESPKWYYAKKRYIEARKSLTFLEMFNKSDKENVISIEFDTEL